ncbi:MAG: SDR family oxidoreductase [Alphaproteobacteria bacterium]|nr:SDR family oxidoreductase [Alphaproteobacteria bacterium]
MARPYLHHPSLRDRVVLITGGGRGFGWHIAEELLRAGAKVMLTASRKPEELTAVKKQAEAIAGPGRCATVRADVAKWEDCQATIEATLKAFGRIDVLVNNAGRGSNEYRMSLAPGGTKFYEVAAEAFRTIIETNSIGPFYMTKAAVPHMLKQKFGKVFSISTSLDTMCRPGISPYGASKAALELTHRVWAQELKGTGVDVNILLPGGASDTAFITAAMRPGAVGTRAGQDGMLPGDVIVPPAVWLCSDATNGMTGERIIAKFWDEKLPPDQAMKKCLQPHNQLPGIM